MIFVTPAPTEMAAFVATEPDGVCPGSCGVTVPAPELHVIYRFSARSVVMFSVANGVAGVIVVPAREDATGALSAIYFLLNEGLAVIFAVLTVIGSRRGATRMVESLESLSFSHSTRCSS